ncbi:MAG: hypothetical protein DI564_12485 [Rhodanobacter denitrificans]|uniref:Uncharacterized protein n=1 Tax=Rhodanobacter denitrificans TaxID=666685 RepID=A0A2W5KBQ9_9GAMM|nr:MAG: hypothetical protein DI564_12485 [Rhodanobacter denitrificans]
MIGCMNTPAPAADLVAALDALERRLPQIVAAHPDPGAFACAWSAEAEAILALTRPVDESYANGRVAAMLAAAGVELGFDLCGPAAPPAS